MREGTARIVLGLTCILAVTSLLAEGLRTVLVTGMVNLRRSVVGLLAAADAVLVLLLALNLRTSSRDPDGNTKKPTTSMSWRLALGTGVLLVVLNVDTDLNIGYSGRLAIWTGLLVLAMPFLYTQVAGGLEARRGGISADLDTSQAKTLGITIHGFPIPWTGKGNKGVVQLRA